MWLFFHLIIGGRGLRYMYELDPFMNPPPPSIFKKFTGTRTWLVTLSNSDVFYEMVLFKTLNFDMGRIRLQNFLIL